MTGSQLASGALIIHGANTRFENVASVFRRVPAETRDTVWRVPPHWPSSHLNRKKAGAPHRLGGGTAICCLYNDVAATAGSLGIGGDHITNALAFNILPKAGKRSPKAACYRPDSPDVKSSQTGVGFPTAQLASAHPHRH